MILLVGFERFGKISQNNSEIIVRKFPNTINHLSIQKKILPVIWKKSIELYTKILSSLGSFPDFVLLLGIHSGKKVFIERFGWNLAYGIDNNYRFKFGFIKFGKPIRIVTSINLKNLYRLNKKKKIFSISSYPGFYLCNFIYYWALFLAKKKYPVLFVHIPQSGNLDEQLMLIKEIIKVIFEWRLIQNFKKLKVKR